jgi:Gpi18-like mannosyltransferase
MYGLNPFVLIEGISNVHNDMFVLLFILVATYMLVKKKNIWATVVFLSLAAAIKYFAILLLPIFVLYYYKDKKLHTRMLLGGACILFFVALVLIFYLPFVEDFEVFKGMQTQQGKLAKSMYVAIRLIFPNYATVPGKVNRILILTFIILYFIKCLNLLIKKEIKIEKEMREHTIYLMIFLFLLITNFQPWYLIWLFYCIFWQKKENVFYLINLCLSTLFANCVFLLNSEAWTYGGTFFGIILVAIIGLKLLGDNKKIRSLYGKISFD